MSKRFRIATPHKKHITIINTTTTLSIALFLLWSKHTYSLGFPLDDAWIHQTYARNLADGLGWVYRTNTPSAGATAPLWVLVLALGHLIHLPPLTWVILLGWLTLTAFGWLGLSGWNNLVPNTNRIWALGAALILATEWHLVWASISGMETALFTLCTFSVLTLLALPKPRWALIGFLIALGIWLRPEMLGLWGIAILGWAMVFQRSKNLLSNTSLRALLAISIPPAIALSLLIGFNYHLTGHIWQNTFYAKQAEYASLRAIPFWQRWLREAMPPLIGINALLAPGILFCPWRARPRQCILPILWAIGHITVYALRLPVTYQHGRYLMPVIPVLSFWGFWGWHEWITKQRGKFQWVVQRAFAFSVFLTVATFLILGANAYAQDVAFIESEMVATAQWGAKHLPPQTRVAIHDIGAWGYYTHFPLIDLAGLISPDVIPVIRSENGLRRFIEEHHAQVLVTFPDWYPNLTKGLPILYFNPKGWGTRQGGTHMTIYRWK